MRTIDAELLFRPGTANLEFLPEGPYSLGQGRMSWVAIQYAPDDLRGALNIFDTNTGTNQSYELPGRPGFAFPTSQPNVFVIGMERSIVLFDLEQGITETLVEGIDDGVEGTIINDGVLFEHGIVFGCKDTAFETSKAGLYFFRRRDHRLFTLRTDQLCSNGKFIGQLEGDSYELFDIDTPTKKVVRYVLDIETGELSEPTTAINLNHEAAFPDGMIQVPGRRSVIIAMFNPEAADQGHAKQFSLATGEVEAVWQVPESPQVTCPQVIETPDGMRLVLTTAAENMSPEKRAAHANAGYVASSSLDRHVRLFSSA